MGGWTILENRGRRWYGSGSSWWMRATPFRERLREEQQKIRLRLRFCFHNTRTGQCTATRKGRFFCGGFIETLKVHSIERGFYGYVRFTPKSRHRCCGANVRLVPKAGMVPAVRGLPCKPMSDSNWSKELGVRHSLRSSNLVYRRWELENRHLGRCGCFRRR